MNRFLTFSMFLAALAPAARANLLTNGNFDLAHAVEVTPLNFQPQPDNWIQESTRANTGSYLDALSSEPWAGPAPTPITTDGAADAPHPDGVGGPDGGVFFKPFTGGGADGLATSHLYQDQPATPGVSYTLSGWAGVEANALMDAELALDFLDGSNVVIGSAELDLIAAGLFTDNGAAFDYKKFSISGVAPVGTAAVRSRVTMFGAQSNPAGGGQAFVVDDFELTVEPVPEASTVSAVGAVALAAFVAWRRKASRQSDAR